MSSQITKILNGQARAYSDGYDAGLFGEPQDREHSFADHYDSGYEDGQDEADTKYVGGTE